MCIPVPTLSGQTGFPITNGERVPEVIAGRYGPERKVFGRIGKGGSTSIGILLFGLSACSSLEPLIMEPGISDLQLTVDTLKISLRDAQRTVAELRAEVDARRQELADVQIARAQLEGRIREAERRLAEARHVIGLQREELADSRSEREQFGRTRVALQNQLTRLQKQLSRVEKQATGNVSPEAMAFPRDGRFELATIGPRRDAWLAAQEGTLIVPRPVTKVSETSSADEAPEGFLSTIVALSTQVVVKSGDTLWSIARRYHTSVGRLMAHNALSNDRIHVGQVLWLTDPPIEAPEQEPM